MFRCAHESRGGEKPRRQRGRVVFCCLIAFLPTCLIVTDAFAGAAVQRVKQQREMMQRAMMQQQYQAQQQAVAQQQAQIQAQAVAYQQAQVQQAAYQKAAMEYAAYKQAMQQAVAKRTAELQAAEQLKQMIAQKQAAQTVQVARAQQAIAYKQTAEMVAYKQAKEKQAVVQGMAQAEVNQQVKQYADFLAQRKQALTRQAIDVKQANEARAISTYNAQQKMNMEKGRAMLMAKAQTQVAQQSAMQQLAGQRIAQEVMAASAATTAAAAATASAVVNAPDSRMPQDQTETTVDITDLWNALDRTSYSWEQIVDDEIKLLTVSEYIDRFGKIGIKIKKAPGNYVNFINALAMQNPGLMETPFMNVLSYAAIVEYDFENGENKDELARRLLGEEGFRANKQRVDGK